MNIKGEKGKKTIELNMIVISRIANTLIQTSETKCTGSASGVVDKCWRINSSGCFNQRSTPRIGS